MLWSGRHNGGERQRKKWEGGVCSWLCWGGGRTHPANSPLNTEQWGKKQREIVGESMRSVCKDKLFTSNHVTQTIQNLKSYQTQSRQHTWKANRAFPTPSLPLYKPSVLLFSRIIHNNTKAKSKKQQLTQLFSFPSLHSLLLPITAPAGEAGLPLLLPWPRPLATPTPRSHDCHPKQMGEAFGGRHTPH